MLNELLSKLKKEAYAVSEKKQIREATIDYKKNYKSKLENAIKANEKYHKKRFGGIRRYHITANLEQVLHFNNVYSKKGGYKKNELSDKHKTKVQMIRESQVIEAKTEEIYVNTNVDNCEFIDIVNETGMTASLPSTMFLKHASPVNYTFTTEERKFLKN